MLGWPKSSHPIKQEFFVNHEHGNMHLNREYSQSGPLEPYSMSNHPLCPNISIYNTTIQPPAQKTESQGLKACMGTLFTEG